MTTRNRKTEIAGNGTESKGGNSPNGTPIIGIAAVADALGYSQRTVCNWRQEFDDFPVRQDKISCVWESTKEELMAWKAAHPDLFTLHKERRYEREANNGDGDGRRPSRW